MFWEEESPAGQRYVVPDDVIDMVFAMRAQMLPLDHAYALSTALCSALPWFAAEPLAAPHLIHGAESGNGWFRPDATAGDALFYPSRRTRLELRLPKTRMADAVALSGQTLDLGAARIEVGAATVRLLSPLTTLFSRYVAAPAAQPEDEFLAGAVRELQGAGLRCTKLLCGREHWIATPGQRLYTRSLMVSGLSRDDAVRVQMQGLGPWRKLGLGLFVPHKGIEPVHAAEET